MFQDCPSRGAGGQESQIQRGRQMLLVTEEAASAIDGILASRKVPGEAGVRITAEVAASGSGNGVPQTELRFAVAMTPQPNDQVLQHAAVFLEPEAAALLDDKVLDADVAGPEVTFDLRDQTLEAP